MNEILLIIPAFNEEGNIVSVVDRIINEYPELDYVIINDGSTDNTSRICHEHGYNIIDHPENAGLAAAFHTGMKYAYDKGYQYAAQFDADGQHRAEFVDSMRKKMDEGYDIVIASRFVEGKKPVSMRMLGSNMIQQAIKNKTGIIVHDPTSGMRMYNRKLIRLFAEGLNLPPEPSMLSTLILKGAKIAEVPAVMDERTSGESYLTPVKAANYMWRMLSSINKGN